MAFKTSDTSIIILEILKKGELQVGEKERSTQLESIHKDVATIITEKCIHPQTKRPYTLSMIEKAMSQLHISLSTSKSSKVQANEIIKQIQEKNIIPIVKAQMKLKLTCPSKEGKKIKEKLKLIVGEFEDEEFGDYDFVFVFSVDPGLFRVIGDLLQAESKGKGVLEVLEVKESKQGDELIE